MVPGSTFRYGSNFIIVTRSPRSTSSRPSEAAAIPLPSDETTPPVTKMYFVGWALELASGRTRRESAGTRGRRPAWMCRCHEQRFGAPQVVFGIDATAAGGASTDRHAHGEAVRPAAAAAPAARRAPAGAAASATHVASASRVYAYTPTCCRTSGACMRGIGARRAGTESAPAKSTAPARRRRRRPSRRPGRPRIGGVGAARPRCRAESRRVGTSADRAGHRVPRHEGLVALHVDDHVGARRTPGGAATSATRSVPEGWSRG